MFQQTLRGIIAATALIAISAVAAEAQKDEGSRFAIQGGYSMPSGTLGDFVDGGFQLGGAYFFTAGSINMRVNADWTRYAVSGGDSGNWTQLGAMVNALIPFGEGPYGLGGVGYYNQKLSLEGESASESDLAWNVGFGFSGKKAYVEARYQSIMTSGDKTTSIPIVFGFKF